MLSAALATALDDKPEAEYSLEYAFPEVNPGISPCGSKILVQMRRATTITKGGIIVPKTAQQDDDHNTQIAKVLAVGPIAFHKRDTRVPWPEGPWVEPGDYIRAPLYGGDRWRMQIPNAKKGEEVVFLMMEDFHIIGKLTCSPLDIPTFW